MLYIIYIFRILIQVNLYGCLLQGTLQAIEISGINEQFETHGIEKHGLRVVFVYVNDTFLTVITICQQKSFQRPFYQSFSNFLTVHVGNIQWSDNLFYVLQVWSLI